MSRRRIRRQCQELVDSVTIPSPFDIEQFCAGLAADRGRPIDLRPWAMPPEVPCGLWFVTGDRDIIFYEKNTSKLHQEHIIMHEVGHLVADHPNDVASASAVSRLLLPNLDPALISRVLRRAEYTDHQERVAETIATLILQQANRWKPVSQWEAPPEGAQMRRHLGETLEPMPDRRRP